VIYSSNCITPDIDIDLSKVVKRKIAIAKGTKVKIEAIYLISLAESPGTRIIIPTPASGRKIIVER